MNSVFKLGIGGLFLIALSTVSHAEDAPGASQKAWTAAVAKAVQGPHDVALGDQAVFHMSSEMFFVPKDEAGALMRAWGNSVGDGFHGLVFSKREDQQWTITIDHVAEGYVKDDDAKT